MVIAQQLELDLWQDLSTAMQQVACTTLVLAFFTLAIAAGTLCQHVEIAFLTEELIVMSGDKRRS